MTGLCSNAACPIPRKHAAGQVKRQVPKLPHAIVDVVPEDVQEQHVKQDMQPVFVQELVREVLPQRRVLRIERAHLLDGVPIDDGQRAMNASIR